MFCQVSMATDLSEGVFNRILLKTAKNGHFETLFQLCLPLPPSHFEDNWNVLTFHLFLIYRTWISKNLDGFG